MSNELWRPSLDLALHRNRQSPVVRFVQLATVREDGRPAVRTVVWRGFLDDGARLVFATDARSRKWAEVEGSPSPRGEACWYFHVTREQFRLAGTLAAVDSTTTDPELREVLLATWRGMSDASRLTYTWPEPGRPRAPLTPFPTEPPDPLVPLPHFGLLVLDVREVDHLELVGNPQHRWSYEEDEYGRWSAVEINP
ncbi:Npun_F5749 family FMN-dependent PPOX-type flavoprotein [Aquisphaera giovannonii]|nr:Npun_F5749 family FMN-dependent PPOX-type flavoprotein [Aquisphaera giovannonii]